MNLTETQRKLKALDSRNQSKNTVLDRTLLLENYGSPEVRMVPFDLCLVKHNPEKGHLDQGLNPSLLHPEETAGKGKQGEDSIPLPQFNISYSFFHLIYSSITLNLQ